MQGITLHGVPLLLYCVADDHSVGDVRAFICKLFNLLLHSTDLFLYRFCVTFDEIYQDSENQAKVVDLAHEDSSATVNCHILDHIDKTPDSVL